LIPAAPRRWFPWIQLGWLILLSPFILFITVDRWWWLLGIPAIWLASRLIRGFLVPPTPLNLSVGVIAGMAILSLLITPDLKLSLPQAAGLFLGLAWFFAIVDFSDVQRSVTMIAGGLLGFGVVLSVLAVFVIQWLNKSSLLAAITSQLPHLYIDLAGIADGLHPNQVAGALLWVFPLCAVLAIGLVKIPLASKRWAVVTGLCGLWLLLVLLLTQSRSAWFGIVVSGAALLAVISRSVRRALVVLAIVSVIVLLIVTPNQAGRWLFGESPVTVTGIPTWSFRLEVWRVAEAGVLDFPITGMGIGTFEEIGRLFYAFDVSADYHFGHAHNEFFQAALDLGLPGLIAFVAVYMLAFWMLRVTLIRTSIDQPFIALLALGSGAALLAHLIYGLTDAIALGSRYGILFWVLLGFITGLFQTSQPERITVH
jgi:putative inorganic carbon (HCO3(-)) transporter